MKKETKELVNDITDYLNTFNTREKEFCEAMSCEHRTLQQNFTRLCFEWIEHCASAEYRTDGRNEGSQRISQAVLSSFKEGLKKGGASDSTLDEWMGKPSKWLRYV
jgi:hypothetical protein